MIKKSLFLGLMALSAFVLFGNVASAQVIASQPTSINPIPTLSEIVIASGQIVSKINGSVAAERSIISQITSNFSVVVGDLASTSQRVNAMSPSEKADYYNAVNNTARSLESTVNLFAAINERQQVYGEMLKQISSILSGVNSVLAHY